LRDPPPPSCSGLRSFSDYLTVADKIHSQFIIHSYSEEKLLAIAISSKDLTKFDPAKYSLEPDAKVSHGVPGFNVYSKPADTNTVFCLRSVALTDRGENDGSKDKCSQSTIKTPANSSSSTPKVVRILPMGKSSCAHYLTALPQNDYCYCEIFDDVMQYLDRVLTKSGPQSKSSAYSIGFAPRSAGEMVRYLGDILYYQAHSAADLSHNALFTLEPILEVGIQFEVHGLVRRLSMMRIIARRMNAVTVLA
jgi:hypothetical protein